MRKPDGRPRYYELAKKTFAGLATALSTFSLLLQTYLVIEKALIEDASLTLRLTNLLSFFTIEVNILVCLSFFSFAIGGGIFLRSRMSGGIALYIVTVFIVYNSVLRGLFPLYGWDKIANELLHVVMPVTYVIFWMAFVPKGRLSLRDVGFWMIYPLAYLIYSLTRGQFVNWYPYPFVNVDQIGLKKVLINSSFLFAGFFLLSLLLIQSDRLLNKNNPKGVN